MGQLVSRALELAKQYGIKSGQGYGLYGIGDLVTLAALKVVFPDLNKNAVVWFEQENPDLAAINKQEKLAQIVKLD